MVKNVKIHASMHRSLSIKASELGVKKSDLCDALIVASLSDLTDQQIREYVLYVTSHDNLDDPDGTIPPILRPKALP